MLRNKYAGVAVIVAVSSIVACRADESELKSPAHDEVVATSSTTSAHSTEVSEEQALKAKAGPDAAFFVQVYLQEALVHLANDQSYRPAYAGYQEGAHLQASGSVSLDQLSGFDFRKNFTDERLALMVDLIMFANDSDHDGQLSASEAAYLELNPEPLGNPGDSQEYRVQDEVFAVTAGDDLSLDRGELQALLMSGGLALQDAWQDNTQSTYRELVEERWEKILAQFDQDGDGILNLDEIHRLRQERRDKLDAYR